MAPPPKSHHQPHPALPTVAESRWEDELSLSPTATSSDRPVSPLLQRGPHYSLQDKARAAAAASKAAAASSAATGAADAQPNEAPSTSSNGEGDFAFSVPSSDSNDAAPATASASASASDDRAIPASDESASNGDGQRAPARLLRPLSIEYPAGSVPGAQKSPSSAEYVSSSAGPRTKPRGRRASNSPHGSSGAVGPPIEDVESLLSPGLLNSNHPNLYLPNPRPSPRLEAHPRLFPRGLSSHPSSSNLSGWDSVRYWFSSTFGRSSGGTPLTSPTMAGPAERGAGGSSGRGWFGGKLSAHFWLLILLLSAVGLVVAVMVCVWLVVLAKNDGESGNPADYFFPPGPHALLINEVQVVGSRNSYHVSPEPEVMGWLIKSGMMSFARTANFTHKPLQDQLSAGYRFLHLDVLYDPEGGRYSYPNVYQHIDRAPNTLIDLSRPGYKVMRMQDVDFLSTCATLRDCLAAMKAFSDQHPRHLPITVNIDFGEGSPLLARLAQVLTRPLPITQQSLLDLESEILSVLPRSQIITPDEVRGSHTTLSGAIATRTAWPSVSASAGRFLFLLSHPNAIVTYRQMSPALEGRVLFTAPTAAGEGDVPHTPDQAILIVESLDSLAADLVSSGHMVACPVASLRSELAVFMWEQAMRAGCQFITVADLWNEQKEAPVGTGSDGTETGLPSRSRPPPPPPSSPPSFDGSGGGSADGLDLVPGQGGAGLGGVDSSWEVQGLHGGPLLELPLLVAGGTGVQAKCLKGLNKEECEKAQWTKIVEPVPQQG